MEQTLIRGFAALLLPNEIVVALRGIQQAIQRQAGQGSARWVGANQMHLTLRFFGNVRKEQLVSLASALEPMARETAAFRLQTGTLGFFPEIRHPKVVWIGIEGDLAALTRVQSILARQSSGVGDHAESRSFAPHLTLARVKTTRPRELDALRMACEGISNPPVAAWEANALEFIQSSLTPRGPEYSPVATLRFSRGSGTAQLNSSGPHLPV